MPHFTTLQTTLQTTLRTRPQYRYRLWYRRRVVLALLIPLLSSPTAVLASMATSANTTVTNAWTPEASSTLTLPSLRGSGLSFDERYEHDRLGAWSLQRINGSVAMTHDPWVLETLTDMTWRINAQARQQAPLGLVLIDSPSINAFAAPGGVIGINTGTILAARSMDELASVVAHEVAHISQRHYESQEGERRKALLLQIGGMLAAIAASAVDGNAAAAVMAGSQTASMNSTMAFSRSNEREADRVGMQIMMQAGYDPKAMASFFATMNQRRQLNQSGTEFLPSFVRSHPLSDERLSEAQLRAQRYLPLSLSQQQRHQALFELLQWRVKIITKHTTQTALETAAKHTLGAKVALMSWYGEKQRYDDANTVMSELNALPTTERQALEPLLSITISKVLSDQDNYQQAVEVLEAQQRLYPERRDLRLYLAQALIDNNQPAEAQSLVKPLTRTQPSDRHAWQVLQFANEKLAKTATSPALSHIATINALRYRSHTQLWSGRYDAALTSLYQAKRLAAPVDQSSTANRIAPLLANINAEITAVKTAKRFTP